MKTGVKILLVSVITFIAGLSVNNFAISDTPDLFKIAIVDIPKVIDSSPQAAALKAEQKKEFTDLASFVGKARVDIDKEKDPSKKKALEEKYQNEFNSKRNVIEQNYENKLVAINNDISAKIAACAKANNYNIVLAKGVVLYGGEDITPEVIKNVK